MSTPQKRIIAGTGLYASATPRSNPLIQLSEYCVVTPTGQQQQIGNPPVLWTQIQYTDQFKGPFTGWVYDGYLEDWPNPGNVVQIDPSVQLPYLSLGVQDILYSKIKQVNLCGEFSVAHIAGDGIVGFLGKWVASAQAVATGILTKGLPTGIDQIKTMLAAYGIQGPFIGFLEAFRDPVIGKRPYLVTPGRMAKLLQDHWLIAGVKIDNRTGEFVRSGGANHVGHWVVIESVAPFGINNGYVHLYNPFPNNYQTITFRLLMQSMGAGDPSAVDDLSGIWIPKPPPVSTSSEMAGEDTAVG